MDIQCASLTPNIKYEGHEHLLTLVENIKDTLLFCEACSFRCVDFCVRCVECNISYHVQCGEDRGIKSTIVYENYLHPLTLTNLIHENNVNQFYCNSVSCKKEVNPKRPFYFCGKCNHYFHIRCVVSKMQVEERDKVKHFSHRHFLSHYSKDNDVWCYASKKSIFGPSFGCSRCNFFLHQPCFESRKEVMHLFHPHHPLMYIFNKSFTWNACQNRCLGAAYHCDECKFDLDDECALLKPSIKNKGHEHLLTFFKKIFDDPECEACKLTYPNASYLRCVKCNFNVHLLCVPLPCTIKHNSHIHPLTLNDCFVEDDSGEYYCYAYETERDPRECVYHCAGCSDYVVHVSCVIDEVLLTASQLRLPPRHHGGATQHYNLRKFFKTHENKIITKTQIFKTHKSNALLLHLDPYSPPTNHG